MSQSQGAIPLWDKVLRSNKGFARILEFGTTWGVFSRYLQLWAQKEKARFYTYDIYRRKRRPFDLGSDFYHWDIFAHEEEIGAIIHSHGQSIIFCDNGDKAREVQTFSKYLKSGDIIAVHDWDTEVFFADIPPDLAPVFVEESKREKMTRFFKHP